MSRAGYVLAGGRSSRMGRDKALLPFRGAPLAVWVARAVELAAGSVTLVGDPQRYASLGFPVVPDAFPGEGPLGGIVTALRHSRADWILAAACDMAGVSGEFLRRVIEAAEAGRADALLPVGPSGRPEPLCAAYNRRALPALEAAFGGGVRGVKIALERVRTATLAAPEMEAIRNVNTPEEWAAHAG